MKEREHNRLGLKKEKKMYLDEKLRGTPNKEEGAKRPQSKEGKENTPKEERTCGRKSRRATNHHKPERKTLEGKSK